MADMREYKETIKAAVAEERKNDENWSWSIKGITKQQAQIAWSYLGPKDGFFTVEAYDEGDGVYAVVGTAPNGMKVYKTVGDTRWDDAKTVEQAIEKAIKGLAEIAHSRY